MKTTLFKSFVALTALALSTSAFAAEKKKASDAGSSNYKMASPSGKKPFKRAYGMGGCGLGSYVVGTKSGFVQVFGVTTNQMTATTYFGITTGTSNCVDGPTEEVAFQIDNFIDMNKAAFAADVSRGNGETISTLATLMGCSDTALLGQKLQQNFNVIYPHERIETMRVTDSVVNVINDDSALRSSCSKMDLLS